MCTPCCCWCHAGATLRWVGKHHRRQQVARRQLGMHSTTWRTHRSALDHVKGAGHRDLQVTAGAQAQSVEQHALMGGRALTTTLKLPGFT